MQKCSHCQNQFTLSALERCIDGEKELFFCCNGCKSVYFLLKDYNIESFYTKLKDNVLSRPASKLLDYSYYDSEEFTQRYISKQKDHYEITFLIHHIHCQACIWLNEVMLSKLNGVLEANINYTNHQATLVWNPKHISLSQIIQMIYNLGYSVSVGEMMEQKKKEEEHLFLTKIIVAIFCSMNIMWVAVAQYGGYFQGIAKEYSILLNSASFLLCTPVIFFSGSIFYKSALRGLKAKRIGMDLLIFSGSFLTYLYSIYASLTLHETYFESASMILTFILLGKFLEKKARENTGTILQSLYSLIPPSIKVKDQTLLPQEVKIGSVVEVFAGEKIIIDGVLESPFALLDESSISGESKPITKYKGDLIYSGSLNLTHHIFYKTTHTFEKSTLNTLIELLKKAQHHKPKIQKLANQISSRFSQIVLLLALVTFLSYLYLGHPFDIALKIAVSVIIIACPCALALATPIANIAGLNEAFKNKILFKEGRFLETLAQINLICFDKTGTLTRGKPQVIHRIDFCPYDQNLLRSFLQKNIHPIAQGVLSSLPSQTSKKEIAISNLMHFPSQGVRAKINKEILWGGNLEFLQNQNIKIPDFAMHEGSIFGFGINQTLHSIFFLQDEIKPHAKELIDSLKKKNIEIFILSGDESSEVRRVAEKLGIHQAFGKLSISQKVQMIQNLRRDGNKVAMIGDGINDSLALKASEVGISIAEKSDLAIQNSDIVLLQDQLLALEQTFNIAQKTYKTIKTNIYFSLFYNTLTIPLAILGYISPIFAALSMSASSLIVVFNSLRIKSKNLRPAQQKNLQTKGFKQ